MTTAAATTPAVALAERDDSELLALIRADDEDDELRDAQRADMVFHSHSLDAPLYGQEDPATLSELMGQEDPQVEHTLDMESVLTHWSDLPEREQRILTMRFYGNMTQAEIGERLGISQMHVSRLLARALRYLRDRLLEEEDEEESAARPGDAKP